MIHTQEIQAGTNEPANDLNENLVEMKGVKKSFGDNHVLKDINFTIKKGENVVVLGKSGTGKSVLIKCIVGLIDPDGGVLNVFGKDVLTMNDKDLSEVRTKAGFLFQSGALYDSMTVRENLEFPVLRKYKSKPQEEIDTLVEEALANVGLEDTADKMPSELSGGMRKRISLARTIILKPELLLYDEPTTGLDPITSQEISELILEVQKKYKTASIIITHDIKCAKITADRIMVLDQGAFVAEGTFEELKNSKDDLVRSFFT
ncbi:MAG: ATP-binding cassette protein [Bacteroidetes bacterium]|jgi:phospholipid/cholesterol/gamma-HCH transport system ATP-binding protein|nr:ATP-binding cassette protein [Bacteroidota bacterium]